jgi:hypothetical protein
MWRVGGTGWCLLLEIMLLQPRADRDRERAVSCAPINQGFVSLGAQAA